MEVVSGPPDPLLDDDIPVHRLPCLDLYNPDDLFRVPSVSELADPIHLIEWLGVSTMGFPEPFTFGLRAFLHLRHAGPLRRDPRQPEPFLRRLGHRRRVPTVATIHHPITVDRDIARAPAPVFLGKDETAALVLLDRHAKTGRPRLTGSSPCRTRQERHQPGVRHPGKPVYGGAQRHRPFLFRPLPHRPRAGPRDRHQQRRHPAQGPRLPSAGRGRHREREPDPPGGHRRPKKRARRAADPRAGHRDRVTFTGRIDAELVRQYARAAMAVIPSVYEGFGLPAGEAMACGVPVISTTGGALPEVVGDAGILVPPAIAEALAAAITALADPDLAARLGEAGYRVTANSPGRRRPKRPWQPTGGAIRDHRRL